jgi:hypothetical protein
VLTNPINPIGSLQETLIVDSIPDSAGETPARPLHRASERRFAFSRAPMVLRIAAGSSQLGVQ